MVFILRVCAILLLLAVAPGADAASGQSPFAGGFAADPAEEINSQVAGLYEAGKYDEALPLARKALKLTEQTHGSQGQIVAKALNNLAWLLQASGDYSGARPLFERALAINENAFGADDCEVATSLNNLAALVSFQGDCAAARPLYERALRIQEKALGPDDPQVGETLNNLAVLLESTGQTQGALPLYERALAITAKALGPEHPNVATSMNNLGSLYEAVGNLSSATSLFEHALKIRESALPKDHPDIAESLNNLAMVLTAGGDTTRARQLLNRALQIDEHSLGPYHPDVASALNNLGRLDWKQGRTVEAQSNLLRSAGIINHHIENVLPSLSFAEQRAFLATKVPEEISLLLSTCRSGQSLSDAYNFIFRWKGLLIESLRWQKSVLNLGEQTEYHRQVEQLKSLRSRLAAWYHEAGSVPYSDWEKTNNELTASKEALERELARSLKPGSLTDILSTLSLSDFCHLLSADELLVDIYCYLPTDAQPEQLSEYGAVLSNRKGPLAFVDLGSVADDDKALYKWRKQVLFKNEASTEWEQLAKLLWKPVVSLFPGGISKIWLSPDGQLSRLPWHLFAAASPVSSMVAQLDSARELAGLRLLARPKTAAQLDLLLGGGIDFGSTEADKQIVGYDIPSLPGTLKEAEELRKLAEKQGMKVTFLTGSQASKAEVLKALPHNAWVHLATHGFFFDEARLSRAASRKTGSKTVLHRALRNPLVESGIVLAKHSGGTTASSGSGRYLTAEEMVGANLAGVQLMTLSACETGLGESATGQGVLGLRASIMAAGARSILMSLWKVPDEATMKLMQEFYTNLWVKKLSSAEALRQAQLTVKNEPYDRFARPINWAAWVLVGESW